MVSCCFCVGGVGGQEMGQARGVVYSTFALLALCPCPIGLHRFEKGCHTKYESPLYSILISTTQPLDIRHSWPLLYFGMQLVLTRVASSLSL